MWISTGVHLKSGAVLQEEGWFPKWVVLCKLQCLISSLDWFLIWSSRGRCPDLLKCIDPTIHIQHCKSFLDAECLTTVASLRIVKQRYLNIEWWFIVCQILCLGLSKANEATNCTGNLVCWKWNLLSEDLFMLLLLDIADDIWASKVWNDCENPGKESCNGRDCSFDMYGTSRTVETWEVIVRGDRAEL